MKTQTSTGKFQLEFEVTANEKETGFYSNFNLLLKKDCLITCHPVKKRNSIIRRA
jgi:hypothetical protein